MMEKHTDVRRERVRMSKAPLAAGALTTVILLMTMGDAASAQASTANIVAANTVQSILGPSAVDVSQGKSQRVIEIPRKPNLRSPYQPPSWTPGPPPWAPGKPDWVPGPPPWVSAGLKETVSRLVTKAGP